MGMHRSRTNTNYDGDESDTKSQGHEPATSENAVAEELRRRQQLGHPTPPHPINLRYITKRDWSGLKRWLKIGVVTGLAVVVLATAYRLGIARANHTHDQKAQAAQQEQKRKQAGNASNLPPVRYNSTTYSMGLSYPANWIVSDTPAKLTIVSPNLAMTDLNGQATTGHVIVTIQNQQSNLPGYPAGGATASLESGKLTYAQPSSVQRSQTYVSYVGYTSPSGIDALFLTGDNGYQAGQTVPMSDITKGNPLISVMFAKCSVSFCTKGTPKPLTLQAKSWDKASFKKQVTDLLQSITVN